MPQQRPKQLGYTAAAAAGSAGKWRIAAAFVTPLLFLLEATTVPKMLTAWTSPDDIGLVA